MTTNPSEGLRAERRSRPQILQDKLEQIERHLATTLSPRRKLRLECELAATKGKLKDYWEKKLNMKL